MEVQGAISPSPYLKPDESYTFRSYFLLKFAPVDILGELGATLTRAAIRATYGLFSTTTRLPNLG